MQTRKSITDTKSWFSFESSFGGKVKSLKTKTHIEFALPDRSEIVTKNEEYEIFYVIPKQNSILIGITFYSEYLESIYQGLLEDSKSVRKAFFREYPTYKFLVKNTTNKNYEKNHLIRIRDLDDKSKIAWLIAKEVNLKINNLTNIEELLINSAHTIAYLGEDFNELSREFNDELSWRQIKKSITRFGIRLGTVFLLGFALDEALDTFYNLDITSDGFVNFESETLLSTDNTTLAIEDNIPATGIENSTFDEVNNDDVSFTGNDTKTKYDQAVQDKTYHEREVRKYENNETHYANKGDFSRAEIEKKLKEKHKGPKLQ